MSQNKLLGGEVAKAKRDIRTRYIAGESVPSIARQYGVSDRDIYYHLGKITPDEKGLHTKNADLRRQAIAEHTRKEEQHDQEAKPSTESTAKAPESILSDFNE